jgi:hypothetical protein
MSDYYTPLKLHELRVKESSIAQRNEEHRAIAVQTSVPSRPLRRVSRAIRAFAETLRHRDMPSDPPGDTLSSTRSRRHA